MIPGIRKTLAGVILGSNNAPVCFKRETIAAAGNSQGTSTLVNSPLCDVSAADGTKGVRLPTGAAGRVFFIYNQVATNGLPIYPPTDGTINGGSANAAVTIEGKTLAILINTDGTNWAAIYTANS